MPRNSGANIAARSPLISLVNKYACSVALPLRVCAGVTIRTAAATRTQTLAALAKTAQTVARPTCWQTPHCTSFRRPRWSGQKSVSQVHAAHRRTAGSGVTTHTTWIKCDVSTLGLNGLQQPVLSRRAAALVRALARFVENDHCHVVADVAFALHLLLVALKERQQRADVKHDVVRA